MEDKVQKLQGVVDSLGTAKFAVPTVALDEVMKRLSEKDSSFVLLDSRSEEERKVSSIPGAITKAEFEGAYADKYKDKEVVAFCTVRDQFLFARGSSLPELASTVASPTCLNLAATQGGWPKQALVFCSNLGETHTNARHMHAWTKQSARSMSSADTLVQACTCMRP
jgi:hypothetical protein